MVAKAWLAGAVLLVACGHARLVQRTPDGGTLALAGPDRVRAVDDAHRKMAGHCGPGNYTIVREGEVVIGQVHQISSRSRRNPDGTVVQSNGARTRNAVEWHIEYRCGGADVAQWPSSQPAAIGPAPREERASYPPTARYDHGEAAYEPGDEPPAPPRGTEHASVCAWREGSTRDLPDVDGIPYSCHRYRLMVKRVMACERLPPEAREGYASAWPAVKTSLQAASTPEARSAVVQSCQSAADALCTAGSAVGCEL